jgi:tetratricopeptide (TPR) repeat protein
VFQVEPAMAADRARELVAQGVERLGPELGDRLGLILRLMSLSTGDGAAEPTPAAGDAVALLRDLFERLAETAPLVLFIDDWQWADDISRQALDQIHAIANRGVLLLLATREYSAIEAQLSGASLVHLSPLSLAESEATIGAMLPSPEPFMVARVADYSGGNPLFIEELCHSISRGAGEQRPESHSGWLDALIESRFSRLPEDQAVLVKAASVIGHMIPTWLFEEITGHAGESPVLLDLEEQDFIYRGEAPGTLRFKHGITRDAIYQKVGLSERRTLHLRVVQALRRRAAAGSQEEPFEALAYHYGAGGDPERAAHYAELAGDKAMAVSSLDRAQAQYRAALAALESVEPSDGVVERWNGILRKYGLASVVDPSRDQLPIFLRATAVAAVRGDMSALAWSEFWLGYIYYGLGQARQSITHCERALKAAVELGDDRLIVQVRATLGQAQATACQYGPALDLLTEAIAVKSRNFKGTRASIGLAYSLSCKGFVLADQGNFDAAYALFDEAIAALCGELHEMTASVLTQRCAVCLWQGRLKDAEFYASEGLRISERVRARYLYSMSSVLAAYTQWAIDRAPQALSTMVEATSWLEASDSRQFLSLNYGWLTEALVDIGDIAEARRYASRALRRARQGDRLGEAMAYRALARAAAATGKDRVSDYLARAMASADARQSAHERARTRMCAAELALARGDRTTAADLISQVRPTLPALGMEHVFAVIEYGAQDH